MLTSHKLLILGSSRTAKNARNDLVGHTVGTLFSLRGVNLRVLVCFRNQALLAVHHGAGLGKSGWSLMSILMVPVG